MRTRNLKKQEMRSIIIDGTEYFYVEDIKKSYSHLKINVEKIFYHKDTPLIKGRFIQEKTEFDLMMEKALKKTDN